MKKFLLLAASAAALSAAPAMAQDDDGGLGVEFEATFGITSNYMFRGLSQTDGDAALQAGVTASFDSGFYLGAWGSSVDFGDETDFEVDLFVGYGGEIAEGTEFDVNVTYYAYPNAPDGANYDYFEIIGGISHDFEVASINLKGAYTPENFGETDDAYWLGAGVEVPVADWLSFSANAGYQWVTPADGDYFHYDVGATLSWNILSFDLRYIGTDIEGYDEEVVFSAFLTL